MMHNNPFPGQARIVPRDGNYPDFQLRHPYPRAENQLLLRNHHNPSGLMPPRCNDPQLFRSHLPYRQSCPANTPPLHLSGFVPEQYHMHPGSVADGNPQMTSSMASGATRLHMTFENSVLHSRGVHEYGMHGSVYNQRMCQPPVDSVTGEGVLFPKPSEFLCRPPPTHPCRAVRPEFIPRAGSQVSPMPSIAPVRHTGSGASQSVAKGTLRPPDIFDAASFPQPGDFVPSQPPPEQVGMMGRQEISRVGFSNTAPALSPSVMSHEPCSPHAGSMAAGFYERFGPSGAIWPPQAFDNPSDNCGGIPESIMHNFYNTPGLTQHLQSDDSLIWGRSSYGSQPAQTSDIFCQPTHISAEFDHLNPMSQSVNEQFVAVTVSSSAPNPNHCENQNLSMYRDPVYTVASQGHGSEKNLNVQLATDDESGAPAEEKQNKSSSSSYRRASKEKSPASKCKTKQDSSLKSQRNDYDSRSHDTYKSSRSPEQHVRKRDGSSDRHRSRHNHSRPRSSERGSTRTTSGRRKAYSRSRSSERSPSEKRRRSSDRERERSASSAQRRRRRSRSRSRSHRRQGAERETRRSPRRSPGRINSTHRRQSGGRKANSPKQQTRRSPMNRPKVIDNRRKNVERSQMNESDIRRGRDREDRSYDRRWDGKRFDDRKNVNERSTERPQLTDMPDVEPDITCKNSTSSELPVPGGEKEGLNLFKIPGEDQEADEEIIEEEQIPDWIRCSPADVYFKRDKKNVVTSTKRMQDLEQRFEIELVKRAEHVRSLKPPVVLPPRKSFVRRSQSPFASENEEENEGEDHEEESWLDELNWRRIHPERLHTELWFNLPQEMNDGPLCRCSAQNLKHGIRHNIYPGEQTTAACDPYSNNPDKLFHYRITMSPHTNFLTKSPTVIEHDSHEYIFEGFSIFSHYKIDKVPLCKVIRFNIEYTIHYFEEDMIDNFDVKSLDLFADFLYREVLELYDLDWAGKDFDGACRRFHIMPRFSRDLPDNGKEILSMNEVLNYMIQSSKMLCEEASLPALLQMNEHEWQKFVDEVRGMIVTYPGMRPCSLRIDQLDREQKDANVITFPKIIHFGVRPAQLSYAGDATYQKLWKQYTRMKHLIANKPKVLLKDREKLRVLEDQLQDIRLKGSMKRETTVEINSEGFLRTGIKSDICQHALLLPVLVQHLLFHKCLDVLEERISYKFQDRLLLQLALTHPSFRMNYGTNADHARNSLTNCGKRQLEYGDKRIHFIHTRKRGINTLMYIMSKMANSEETPSEIHHYERLEFLGDAVIEFLSSIHLFFMFPRLEEGGLATYRAALVQNQHLSVLAEKLGLQHFMLYAHGPDLCHDVNIRHALANCFEALMGALFLDGGIDYADRVFGDALFKEETELLYVWKNLPQHPLQDDEPNGDRHWIAKSKPLQNLAEFEQETGIIFKHIRLLARAFTMRNIGYNNLTLGHNQTLEFLGDTVLQLISSEYLFKHFPDHHEGHLTLLRSSLVNNRTQAIICDDLGMTRFVINNDKNVKERINNEQNKVKDKADIVEAVIGAMYVDQGLDACRVFCQVCFFPRLKEFIMNQDWNDAKSQLQQCCLTLRDTSAGEPDIPVYKVLQSIGPTNTRKYHVAVYFRGERLATGYGHSIQQAEMNTAANALKEKADLFPHLLYTKRFLDWRFSQIKSEADDETGEAQPTSTAVQSNTPPVLPAVLRRLRRRKPLRRGARRNLALPGEGAASQRRDVLTGGDDRHKSRGAVTTTRKQAAKTRRTS